MADGTLTFDTSVETSSFNSGMSTIASLASSGLGAVVGLAASAVTAIVKIGTSSVKTGMEFDSAMSQLAATMGTTVDQIEDLEDTAKEMGATTAFSATEAAEGLNILAMAGYDATEQMDMIGSVLNLASAGATSMDNAATYLTTTLKGYCVQSEDVGDMTEYYSDLIAKGASLVNTSVDELGTAMADSAATSNAYSQSVETTTTALLALADGGYTGSEAATALNRVFQQLYAPTDAASSALDKLGVACYDEEGNARDLLDVIEDLQNSTADLSEEERNNYLSTILGTYGLKAYNAISTKSADDIDELTASLTDCTGAAEQMAETQLDNLAGDITICKSATEALQIAISDKLTPVLRGIVQIGTAAITGLTNLLNGDIDLAGRAGELVGGIVEQFQNMDWQQLGESIKEKIITGIETILIDIPQTITEFCTSISETIKETDWHEVGYNLMTAVLEGIKSIITGIPGTIGEIASSIWEAFLETDWQEVGYSLMTAVLTGLKLIIVDIPSAIFEFTSAVVEKIRETDWLQVGKDILSAIIDGIIWGITEGIPKIAEKIGELGSGMLQAFKDFFGINSPSTVMKEQAGYLVEGVSEGIAGLPDAMLEKLTEALQNVTQWGQDLVSQVADAASNVMTNITTWFSQIPGTISGYITTALSNVKTWATNLVGQAKTAASNFLSNIVSSISQVPGKILSYITTALNNVKSWATSLASQARSAATGFLNGIVNNIKDLPSKVLSTLTTVKSNVTSWGTDLVSSFKSIGKNVIQGMINGITSMVSSLYSSIKSALSGLVDKAKSALGIGSPSKVFAEEIGEWIPPGVGVGFEDAMPELEDDMGAELNDLVRNVQASVNLETQDVYTQSRLKAQHAVATESGGTSETNNDNHVEQTNNYYVPVPTPSETSRAQREAARKLVGGVA